MAAAPDVGADDDRCPSCDTVGAWTTIRRHRFSPFGAVTLLALAFWAAVAGLALPLGLIPAVTLVALAGVVVLVRRKADVCQACGFARPHEPG